jgi:hypothetical protein
LPETYYNPMYRNVAGPKSLPRDDDPLLKRRSIAVTPSSASGQPPPNFALPQISEHAANGHAHPASRLLPRPPSNLGVPYYYPPPPQTVSAVADRVPVRKSSKPEASGQKFFSGPHIRPLRISLRSKVRDRVVVELLRLVDRPLLKWLLAAQCYICCTGLPEFPW